MSKTLKLEGDPDALLRLLFGFMSALSPLVIISDLVQNSIEAKADNIKIEIIHKKNEKNGKGIDKIIISDNGFGFLQSFENYSRNIGDSLKKKADIYLEQKEKGELIGEFCIGVHGFRSVASKLEIISLTRPTENVVKDKDGNVIKDPDFYLMRKLRRMTLFKDRKDIIIDEAEDIGAEYARTTPGVTCILSGLTVAAENSFTVAKISQYLSDLKRAFLLKNSKLKIEVIDGLIAKRVEPFKYVGEKFIHKIVLPNQDTDKRMRGFGEVLAEFYYHSYKKGSKIIVTVRGEPIYLDMLQNIEEFNRYPWNSGMVEGTIEYERLSKQPGRVEIQRDTFYDAFIDMLKILEKEVEVKVKEIEKNLQSKQDEKLISRLEDVYGRIKREIGLDFFGKPEVKIVKGPMDRIEPFPDKENVEAFSEHILYVRAYDNDDNVLSEEDGIEFSWKLTGLGEIRAQGSQAIFTAGSIVGSTEIIVTATDKHSLKQKSCKMEILIIHPVVCGSLYRAKIVPGVVAVSINKQRMFYAMAEDMNGNIIRKKITCSWKIIHDTSKGSKINIDSGESIIFTAGRAIGQVKLHLKVQQGKTIKEDYALIDVRDIKKIGKGKKNISHLSLPSPRKINAALEHPMWHSRLDIQEKVLYYNVAHQDYIEVQNSEERRQRYIANLYAKELTLLECKNLGVENYGERLVEVLSKLDKYWNLKI